MKNLNSHSLRLKIIVLLGAVAILFLGSFQGYAYFSLNAQLLKELNEQGDREIQRLANELDSPLWELDETWIKKILQTELKTEQVHAIYVTGDENIVVGVDKNNPMDKYDDADKEERIHRSQSILHNGEKIGEVKLYLTVEPMKERLYHELINAIALATLEIFIIIFLLWIMISHVILRPIKLLVESTKRIADGDYAHPQLKLDDDEIGALGESVHRMKNKIESREKELQLSASQLKSTKERLEYAVNGTQDGLWDWDLQTNAVYFSPRWKSMLGYEDDELANGFETWESRVHPDNIEQAKRDIVCAQEKPGRFYELVHRLRHKDGSWVWILARAQTIFNEEGKAVRMVGFHTDVTKQKEQEQELLDQEELIIAQSRQAAMGEMIGMIAHQWRQPLSVIAMEANNILVDVALEQGTEEGFVREAELILNQTQHLSKTIDDFRNFFRPNKEKNETNVCDVILEAKKIMGTSLQNHNVELLISDTIEETILTYSRELLQVILNLLKNAAEALESNKTKNAFIKVEVQSVGDFITISVCDNGGGMDKAVIGRVFEPYFSTKDAKNGTGLGLYMSKTIIQKHLHGAIAATNKDEGACFTIKLPKVFNA